jgi:predicted nucleotidyltransferase
MSAGADVFALPDDVTVDRTVSDYARAIRKAYGSRLKGIYLFGSRARGDHTTESDADIAVVLADGDWKEWPETKRLTDIAYDFIVATGADLQAWAVPESAWVNPTTHPDSALITAMRRDARPIGAVNG